MWEQLGVAEDDLTGGFTATPPGRVARRASSRAPRFCRDELAQEVSDLDGHGAPLGAVSRGGSADAVFMEDDAPFVRVDRGEDAERDSDVVIAVATREARDDGAAELGRDLADERIDGVIRDVDAAAIGELTEDDPRDGG